MKERIDISDKDLEYTLSTIYGKKAAKILVKQGHELFIQEKQ